ncbi:MAG: rRNA maturation RNase YbeY [Bacteroidota bacterium]
MPLRFQTNERPRFILKQKSSIAKWIQAVIRKEKGRPGNIHFIFCSDKFLLKLNKEYLNHTTLTDIITFDYSEGKTLNGEIYVSVDRVNDNAAKFDTSFENELHRVMIHGILHLCGYKDKTKKEKAEIRKKEEACLRMLNQILLVRKPLRAGK